MSQWSFAIISDIHVKQSGQVSDAFLAVVQNLGQLAPRFVVMSGDATNGNPGDKADEAAVATWWQAFFAAVAPLGAAGTPLLPIAGNHDYYTDAHRRGYVAAWSQATSSAAAALGVALSGRPPLYYAFVLGGVHFTFLHVVDQTLELEVAEFLRSELAGDAARSAALRLGFGHVPLLSMMGKSNLDFCAELGGILAQGNVAAYFSGHEHLYWDQVLAFGDARLRQIHVGTAGGTYHFPLSQSTYAAHCQGDRGTIPYTGKSFDLLPGTRQQKDEVTVLRVHIDLDGNSPGYTLEPLTLRDGRLVPFGS